MTSEYLKNSFNYEGLNPQQVLHSRERNGRNLLTPAKQKPVWQLYFEKYNDPIIRILLAAALLSVFLSFFGGNIIETLGIIIAIVLATTVGFVFELDAAKKFKVLTVFNEDTPVKVRRGGSVMEIPRQDVVVGDIVILEIGDEIPADGDLLEAIGLQVNESSLTGELLTYKQVLNDKVEIQAASAKFAYPVNRVFRSTMVMDGRGVMRVTEVGDRTEIGRVAHRSMESTDIETPLDRQLTKLGKQIYFWGIVIATLVFVVFIGRDLISNNYWTGYSALKVMQTVLQYLMVAVALIVMAVPEGLPMAITLSLALNMRRMLKSNNLVRKLHACETMGAVTVICTDKTGTLTENKMTVNEIITNPEWERLLPIAIAVNTTAEIGDKGEGIGNPTEVALLQWLDKEGCNYRDIRQKIKIIEQIPFSTERKQMKTIVEFEGERFEFVKGAPEIVLAKDMNLEFSDKLNTFQRCAMRTLGFTVNGKAQAIVAISDPLREEVPMAVADCQKAGINVKIVTGDVSVMAIEIAREVGIWTDDTPEECHITGAEFAALSDEEAFRIVEKLKVMSRARPDDKKRLVELLQKHDEVVAVTGDGTNDAPALNYAHVGLSLGSGTSVAKSASDITLLDDSFTSIVKAVMWGRSLYKNLQRFLFFQLVVNVTALTMSIVGPIIGVGLPLTVTQILWVNLIMDTLAALALASLPPSEQVMCDKPRKQSDSIITKKILYSIGLVAFVELIYLTLYVVLGMSQSGFTVHSLTLFFTGFVMLQVWNLLNAKTLNSSKGLFYKARQCSGMTFVIALVLVGQWLIVQFGGDMFRTETLSVMEWLVIIAITSPIMLLHFGLK